MKTMHRVLGQNPRTFCVPTNQASRARVAMARMASMARMAVALIGVSFVFGACHEAGAPSSRAGDVAGGASGGVEGGSGSDGSSSFQVGVDWFG